MLGIEFRLSRHEVFMECQDALIEAPSQLRGDYKPDEVPARGAEDLESSN